MRRVFVGALAIAGLSCGGVTEPALVDEADFVDDGATVTVTWRHPPDVVVERIGYADASPFDPRVCHWSCPSVYELTLAPPDGTNVLRARGSPFVPPFGVFYEPTRFRPCGAPIGIVLEHPVGHSVLQTHVRCIFRLHPTRGERTWG